MYALVPHVLNFLLVVDRKDPVTKSRFLGKQKLLQDALIGTVRVKEMLNAEALKRPSLGLSGITKSSSKSVIG